MSRGPRETQLLGATAAAGVVHTGFSLYWALGGRWLLPTVGEWAVDAVREAPVASTLLLLAVAAVKGARLWARKGPVTAVTMSDPVHQT